MKVTKVIVVLSVCRLSGRERLAGIFNYARQHGPWDVQTVNEDKLISRGRAFHSWNADGVICSTFDRLPRGVPAGKVPTVVFNNGVRKPAAGASTISVDNTAIGEKIARALLAKRLPCYAYVGLDRMEWSVARETRFRQLIADAGFPCNVYVPEAGGDWGGEKTRLSAWLVNLPKPCGLMIGCDAWGRIIMDIAYEKGIGIPDELCVASVDNDVTICEHTIPTLTSLQSDYVHGGWMAAEILDGLMRGKIRAPVHRLHGFGELVERMSSNWLPAVYRSAAMAREFIRVMACTGISVKDVAERANVSRRLLELRFREAFGTSVNDEIRRVRLEHVRKCLRETRLSIDEICSICGYSSESHVKHLFKSMFGTSMREYRKSLSDI